MLSAAFFYLFAAMTVAAGAMVIVARNPVHAVLFLILAFFNAAGLFLILGLVMYVTRRIDWYAPRRGGGAGGAEGAEGATVVADGRKRDARSTAAEDAAVGVGTGGRSSSPLDLPPTRRKRDDGELVN